MNYTEYLEDIESRIDEKVEDALYNDWVTFAEGKWDEEYFNPKRSKKSLSKLEWPKININDAIKDYELMLINELSVSNNLLESGGSRLMHMRSNYGCGIMPSLYGAKNFIMPYETNTKPTVYPLEDGLDGINKAIDSGIPDLNTGWGGKVFGFGEIMMDIKHKYPKISKYIRIDHPDCQGPMDICELLWGFEMFYGLYDSVDLAHKLLRNITDTYKAFVDKWFKLCPNIDSYHAIFGALHKGQITIREDSANNLSPEMFDEFIFKYDEELFEHFSGGSLHYCGRGDHYIKKAASMNGLYAIDLSQPHLNDMEYIFKNTIDKDINILHLNSEAIQEAISRNRPLHGRVYVSIKK